jgi:cell division protein FtsL
MSAQARGAGGDGTLLPLFLAVAVMISALMVVQVKHRSRNLTTQLDVLRGEHERLDLEWSQLQLEEATLAQHGRVDQLARTQFEMVDPVDYQIISGDSLQAASLPQAASAVTP